MSTLKDYFFFQAEDGIRYLVRSRGLGDVYKRQAFESYVLVSQNARIDRSRKFDSSRIIKADVLRKTCLLYTSDAADERSSVDLGGRRIVKKKNSVFIRHHGTDNDFTIL